MLHPPAVGPLAIAIAGPTASGKTALALAVAAHLACTGRVGRPAVPVEIVSVDSALVYRGLDIGTAKPSAAERAAVPHHLIDLRDPAEPYSAADFVADAQRAMADIRSRGALPLLVGGTMLYFRALFDGLDPMPGADAAVRAQIEAEAAEHGWAALHDALWQIDPATAARLPPADSQRVQRALEVYRLTGRALSSFHTHRSTGPDAMPAPQWVRSTLLISLEPNDRAWLHQRIADRFDAMLAQGFMAEVEALHGRAGLSPDLPAMRCVGYRQALQALAGEWPMHELRGRGISATRQLAKRQLTWLRGMPRRCAIACDTPEATAQALAHIDRWLAERGAVLASAQRMPEASIA